MVNPDEVVQNPFVCAIFDKSLSPEPLELPALWNPTKASFERLIQESA